MKTHTPTQPHISVAGPPADRPDVKEEPISPQHDKTEKARPSIDIFDIDLINSGLYPICCSFVLSSGSCCSISSSTAKSPSPETGCLLAHMIGRIDLPPVDSDMLPGDGLIRGLVSSQLRAVEMETGLRRHDDALISYKDECVQIEGHVSRPKRQDKGSAFDASQKFAEQSAECA